MHFKALDNSLHVIEPEFAYMLPSGSVPITDEEAEILRPVYVQSKQDKIAALEAQVTPRRLREAALGDTTFIADIEAQIDALRKE